MGRKPAFVITCTLCIVGSLGSAMVVDSPVYGVYTQVVASTVSLGHKNSASPEAPCSPTHPYAVGSLAFHSGPGSRWGVSSLLNHHIRVLVTCDPRAKCMLPRPSSLEHPA